MNKLGLTVVQMSEVKRKQLKLPWRMVGATTYCLEISSYSIANSPATMLLVRMGLPVRQTVLLHDLKSLMVSCCFPVTDKRRL